MRKHPRNRIPRHLNDNHHLSASITLEDVINAFQNPEDRFEFPIKPFTVDLAPETKQTMLLAAGLLAIGSIVTASIIARK